MTTSTVLIWYLPGGWTASLVPSGDHVGYRPLPVTTHGVAPARASMTQSWLDPAVEPATQRRLLAHERVLLSPHIAGVRHEGKYKMAAVLAAKILAAFPTSTA